MNSREMNRLVAYRVIKGSTDETLRKDDIIWLSNDGTIISAIGFLSKEEWNQETTRDFEVEPCNEYSVQCTSTGSFLIKNEDSPFYCYKENWEELSKRLEKAELELLKIRNNDTCSEKEQKRIDTKLSGLRIALEYMSEME